MSGWKEKKTLYLSSKLKYLYVLQCDLFLLSGAVIILSFVGFGGVFAAWLKCKLDFLNLTS